MLRLTMFKYGDAIQNISQIQLKATDERDESKKMCKKRGEN